MANTTTKKGEQVAHEAIDKSKGFVQSAADATKQQAGSLADQAKNAASTVADQARQAASNVTEGASNMASTAVNKADDAAASAGSSLQSLAGTLRSNTPNEGMLGSASNTLADTIESGGKYLQDQGLTGMADDVAAMVKRNPIPALLIGVGIGYILARATSRS